MTSTSLVPEPALNDDSRLMFAFAHDLRGYLRTILTRVQMVQRTAASHLPEQELRWLDEAGTAATDLNGLIGAMVSYCSVTPVPETINLGIMLRGLKLETEAILKAAAADLIIVNEIDLPVTRALSVVLRELITNACRFRLADARTEIRIVAGLIDSAKLEVTVVDNGSGVDPEWIHKIFEPFRRMHSRGDFPGSGLGLALCRRIMTVNGGEISAANAPSGGLAVTLTLPSLATA